MTTPDWILGVLFRPAATYARAKQELRFGYWWILVSVFTLEVVISLYSPPVKGQPTLEPETLVLYSVTLMMVLFDVQALLLLGVARAFRWDLSWPESLKWVGLSWSVLLLEDVVTFYPALKGQHVLVLLLGAPMFLWYLVSLTKGIKQASGFPTWKALALTLTASLPWRASLIWFYWSTMPHGA